MATALFSRGRLTRTGILIFSTALVAFGVQCLILSQPIFGLEPLPKSLPAYTAWADLSGLLIAGAGVGLLFGRSVFFSAAILAALFFLWIVLLHLPGVIASPTNGSWWTCFFEVLALCGAAILLASQCSGANSPTTPTVRFRRSGGIVGRLGYGISLPAFGVLHLIYPQYVAHGVPVWIPFHLFWAYFVAAAFFAAGAAIISGVRASSAAFWTGIMFLIWVLIVHLPRVLAALHSQAEWTSMFVALAMGGAAWIVAGGVEERSLSSYKRQTQ